MRETMQAMPEIDTSTHDELRLLRERAYGPAADIDQDPAAAQRLRELEARTAEPAPEPAVPAEPQQTSVVTSQEAPTASPTPTAPTPGAPEPPAPQPSPDAEPPTQQPDAPRRRSRLTTVLWALSVAAAAAAAAAVTFSLTYVAPVPVSGDATQIASLEPTTGIAVPTGFIGAGESSRTFEFYGYTIFEATNMFGFSPSQGSDCFVIIATSKVPEEYDAQQGWSYDSPIYNACRAGTLPAVTQFVVDSSAPDQTRRQFPDGAALQFVFDGERVGVFLSED